MKRIVITIAVGNPKFAECALGLGRSLKLIGDTTERVVITDLVDFPWTDCFDVILPVIEPFERTMLSKLSGLERTDAEQVLFIDCDCLAFRRLDDIFEYCSGRGLCVQGQAIQDGLWYGDVQSHLRRHGVTWLPQFNGGMIYYERTLECKTVLEQCLKNADGHKEAGFEYEGQLIPEEPYVALAIAQSGVDRNGNTHLIPDTKDFTNTATGLIGKLTLDVRSNRCEYLCRRFDVKFVRPYIFHASRYGYFAKYWKQLEVLKWLQEYERRYPFGYMSPWHRLDRSVTKRFLRYFRGIKP